MYDLIHKVQERHGTIDNLPHFSEVYEYAREKGIVDKLESALLWACLPSFFGTPAKSTILPDSSPHSFYFLIKNRETGVVIMNGGIIWHASSQEWGVHT